MFANAPEKTSGRRRATSSAADARLSDEKLWRFGGGGAVTLAVGDWPEHDVVRLRQARDPLQATELDTGFKLIKSSSWDAYLYAFAFLLGVLKRLDAPSLALPLAERVTIESVHRVIWHMSYEGRYRNTGVSCFLHALRLALRRLDPETDWGWMHRLQKFYRHHAERRDLENRYRSAREILDLGLAMMTMARQAMADASIVGRGRQRLLLEYRNGLILAFLALLPLRRSNAAALSMNDNLLSDEVNLDIFVPAADHKTCDDLLRSVPKALLEPMTFFLGNVRPELMGTKAHDNLWPALHGGPLSSYGLYMVVVRSTARAFGAALFPHYMRSAAATAAAIHSKDTSLAWRVNGRQSSRNDPCYVHRRLLEVSKVTMAVLSGYRDREFPPPTTAAPTNEETGDKARYVYRGASAEHGARPDA